MGFSSQLYSIRDFGAVGDGSTLDTASIQAAIDACYAARGGVVWAPAGVYRTGTVVLKDNVTLHLAPDATLLGSEDLADYAPNAPDGERPLRQCLIYAHGAKNIGLSGPGTIDGRGAAFPCMSRQASVPAFRGEKSSAHPVTYVRPMLLIFTLCTNVSLRDVLFKDSASWGAHFVACDGLRIDGIRMDNRARPNGDGIDLESCRNVVVSNCTISCDDDAICLKSSIAGQPCEHIAVTNCVISSNTAAVKFGTPSRAGFRDIVISSCVFHDCALGAIKLEVVDGGVLEDVVFSSIAMHRVEGPIFVRLGARNSRYRIPGFPEEDEAASGAVGVLRNVVISGIRATVRNVYVDDPMERVDVDDRAKVGIFIAGIPGYPVEGLTLSDLHITFPGGGAAQDATIQVPEDERMYPEQFFFGATPAYGAFIRHARGVVFHNVRFDLAAPDARPAIVAEDVEDLELAEFRAAGNPDAELIRLQGSRAVYIHGSRSLNGVQTFVRLAAETDAEPLLQENDLRSVGAAVQRG